MAADLQPLLDIVAHHWGFRSLRPLQEEAMRAVLDGRDSLVVLPTGGGKSLCYQAPAAYRGGTTVVISPLIALMKDQVDALGRVGVPAVQIDSSLSDRERFAYEIDIRQGAVRLVFASPERLVNTDFYRLLQDAKVHTFAIDEAHCISHWGHDFRPEYRQLARLRDHFPHATVHGYTATATEQVRRDIITQLGLKDPVVLVGNFDRPNLTYRVLPRLELHKQVEETLDRHNGEAGIIYCLRRADVDSLAAHLNRRGHKVVAYHAGMLPEERRVAQEAFSSEQIDVVVATVAFGMGIDRSNVRFVMHTALPKTLEHYQQETGRAGRDGLDAECVLLFSGADVVTLKSVLEKSAAEAAADAIYLPAALKQLDEMARYCRGAVCRHRALVNYFGQPYDSPSCDACDICLGDTQDVPDAASIAQKILSCVARVKENFGVGHVVGVLRGEKSEGILKWGHDRLTTYGLLQEHPKGDVRDWIYQLIGQSVLVQTDDEYPKLRLNDASWEVMKGKRTVKLIQLVRHRKGEGPKQSQVAEVSWEGVDKALFETLRLLRRDLAHQQGHEKPYLVFSDAVVRDLARIRPSTLDRMRLISGVGEVKLRDFGAAFLKAILDHCAATRLPTDVKPPRIVVTGPALPTPKLTLRHMNAFALFRQGSVIEDVMHQMGLSRSTIVDYLGRFIMEDKPRSIRTWVSDELYERIAAAARQVGTEKLKPIFLLLGEKVSYDDIRLVVAHIQATGAA
jgi:ATP-dependent DNA helicase RecQ